MKHSDRWSLLTALVVVLPGLGCRTLFMRHFPATPGAPSPPSGAPQFSVVWDSTDLNGMPLGPQWATQRDYSGKFPPVPEDENRNQCARHPNLSACSSQATVVDEPPLASAFGIVCRFDPLSQIHGHVDWMPVTYHGYLNWIHIPIDQDYNFRLFPDDEHGLTRKNLKFGQAPYMELEFDSRETEDRFGTPTWIEFAKAARSGDSDAVKRWLDPTSPSHETPPDVVVTGLLNLDCEHDCRSELHPLYALAVETDHSSDDNTWAIMIRNLGNGGSCSGSNLQLELPGNQLRVLLPWKANKKPEVLWDKVEFAVPPGSGIPFPDMAFIPDMGYALTFTLRNPDERDVIELVLRLKWPAGAAHPRRQLPLGEGAMAMAEAASAEGAQADVEGYVESLFKGLGVKPEVKPEAITALALARPARNRIVKPPVPGKIARLSKPAPRQLPAGVLPQWTVKRVPKDRAKQKEDWLLFQQLCKEYRSKGMTLPTDKVPDLPKICSLPEPN